MQLTRRGAARLTSLTALSTLTLVALALAGCKHGDTNDNTISLGSGGSGGGGTIATVKTPKGNTLTLSQADFFAQLQSYVPNQNPQQFAPIGQAAGRLVMTQMLENLMLVGLAQDQGLAPTDAEVNTQYNNIKLLQDARNIKPFEQSLTDAGLSTDLVKNTQIKPQLAQIKLLTKGVTITDADIQSFYNSSKDKEFTKPARVHIKRIVVASLPEAQAISDAIKGGQTFESQVSRSLDKSTPDGDVPQWIPLDSAAPQLATLVQPIKSTAAGQVTPPITFKPNPTGPATYWIVKVVDKVDKKEVVPLDQAKDLVRAQLLQQKAQADPLAQQTLQQSLRDFETNAQVSVALPQYAAVAQALTHPAPLPASSGSSPFAPAAPAKP